MTGERFDPRVLECKALRANHADQFDSTDAMRLFGKNEVTPSRPRTRLNIAQDGIARLSLV